MGACEGKSEREVGKKVERAKAVGERSCRSGCAGCARTGRKGQQVESKKLARTIYMVCRARSREGSASATWSKKYTLTIQKRG